MTPKQSRWLVRITLVFLAPPVAILANDLGRGASTDGIAPTIGKAIVIALDLMLALAVGFALLRAWRHRSGKNNSD
ncbi:MAG TPA: hypothetical protein VMS78_04585 [Rhizomicrobium sp.]|nr:hypothetical protein [Rhizomicrobium sp.]